MVHAHDPRAAVVRRSDDAVLHGAPTPDKVIAHTNLYWRYHEAPGRTAGTVDTAEVDFAA